MPTVPLVAVLFDPTTGKRAEHRENLDEQYADSQWFMWIEGNSSCDCNRRAFLLRASGEIGPYDFPEPDSCGDTIVLERLTVNGEVVVEDGYEAKLRSDLAARQQS